MKKGINRAIKTAVLVLVFTVLSAVTPVLSGTSQVFAAAGTSPYTIKWGDTLYSISRQTGTTVAVLKSMNKLSSDVIYAGQTLTVPVTGSGALKDILTARGVNPVNAKFSILVDKSDHSLVVYADGIPLRSYHVELGEGGSGPKQVNGDHKTPEGTFYICQKSVLSPADPYLGTRWMRLSYPNTGDAARGLRQGMISQQVYNAIVSANNQGTIPPQNTALGGGVGIHGGSTAALGSDWTWGCVGLTNRDVEDFYNYMAIGTKVIIQV